MSERSNGAPDLPVAGREGTPEQRSPGPPLSAMYQDVILAHYRAPRGRGLPAVLTGQAERRNPLCGDEVQVGVRLEGGVLREVGFEGRGCSILMASASMMTEVVRGLSGAEVLLLSDRVRSLVETGAVSAAGLPGDLGALAGVAPYAPRHECALMGWTALGEALGAHSSSLT